MSVAIAFVPSGNTDPQNDAFQCHSMQFNAI